jgi:hypothetical protein
VKSKLQQLLQESDADQLNEILYLLVEKYKYLEDEIELILTPKSIQNPLAYYQRIVKKAIDTNSFRNFPQKGVKGLKEMESKMDLFIANKTYDEAWKIGISIIRILMRCMDAGNIQHVEELNILQTSVIQKLADTNYFLNQTKLGKQNLKWIGHLVANIGWQYTGYFREIEYGKSGLVILKKIIEANQNPNELIEILKVLKIQIEHESVRKSVLLVFLHICLKLRLVDEIEVLSKKPSNQKFVLEYTQQFEKFG